MPVFEPRKDDELREKMLSMLDHFLLQTVTHPAGKLRAMMWQKVRSLIKKIVQNIDYAIVEHALQQKIAKFTRVQEEADRSSRERWCCRRGGSGCCRRRSG